MRENDLSKLSIQLWFCLLAYILSLVVVWELSKLSIIISIVFTVSLIAALLKFFVLGASRFYGVWLSVSVFQLAILFKSNDDYTINVPLGILSLVLFLISLFLKRSLRRFAG
jgi:hypothetical protein